MRPRIAAACAFALVACLSAAVRAEPVEPADSPSPTPWYGWQIAAVDAPLLALAVTSLDGGGEGAMIGVAGLLVSGPIVHGVHGRGGRVVGSAVARVLCPALGALLGSANGRGEHEAGDSYTSLEGAAWGALGGYAVALGLDMAMSVTEIEPERAPPPPAAPVVLVGSSSATVGLVGSF